MEQKRTRLCNSSSIPLSGSSHDSEGGGWIHMFAALRIFCLNLFSFFFHLMERIFELMDGIFKLVGTAFILADFALVSASFLFRSAALKGVFFSSAWL